jgi:hypothetical protein
MRNSERFAKTINWEIPDRLMTYDVIDHRGLLEQFGGEGSLIERNARMASRIGLDVMRGIYDPEKHWVGVKIQDWIRFFGVDPGNWEVTQAGGTSWISRRPRASASARDRGRAWSRRLQPDRAQRLQRYL